MAKLKIKDIKTPTALKEDHSIQEVEIFDLIPNVMGDVVIFERDGEHVIDLPPRMDGMAWKKWLISPAGVFSKDFLRWMRDKGRAEYLLAKGETLKSVIRIIKEDELDEFSVRSLIHGKIKDTYYMHLKTLGINENIHGTPSTFSESREEIENIKEDDEEDIASLKSESLFD